VIIAFDKGLCVTRREQHIKEKRRVSFRQFSRTRFQRRWFGSLRRR
jgi:hypothetical protein